MIILLQRPNSICIIRNNRSIRNHPRRGTGIGELMRITGMSRPTLYRYLA
jgi:hypothetical protein